MKFRSVIGVGAVLMLCISAGAARSRPGNVWDSPRLLSALKKGAFVGPLDHRHVLETIGEIPVGRKRYIVAFYHYEQTWKEAVGFPHASSRLIIFLNQRSRTTYLGFYGLNGPPSHIEGHQIFFPYSREQGNVIDFDETGPPPRAWLDGEYQVFRK